MTSGCLLSIQNQNKQTNKQTSYFHRRLFKKKTRFYLLTLVRPKGQQKNLRSFDVSEQAQTFADTDRFFISLVFLGETVTQKCDQ